MRQITSYLKSRSPWQMRLIGTIELLVAYGFVSWAIDSGSLLHYGLGLGFLVASIKLTARSFKN